MEPGIRTLSRLEGWGMAVDCLCHRMFPRDAEDVAGALEAARRRGLTIGARGGGRSYGDAANNDGGVVLDFTRMNRILSWDPDSGLVDVEPGVTIEQLWRRIVPDGWWPPVVSGTMFTTLGGCAAMNVHGKNAWKVGPVGDHILEFDLVLPTGALETCSRERNADLFHAAISGFGMLGFFTRLRLQMKRVHSGRLWVEAFDTGDLGDMAGEFEERAARSDYLVGWIDCFPGGRSLGRGIVHQANYLAEGEDPAPRESLRVAAQDLPSRLFGVMPKSMMWMPLALFVNNPGMRAVNAAKYWSGRMLQRGAKYQQSHAAFAFLLDYVPGWKQSYKPLLGDGRGCGLIQYQSFIPRGNAVRAFERLLAMGREAGLPAYLGVFKKHRPDDFLLTHGVDGYSLALDFRVTRSNRPKLWDLCRRMDEVVLGAGGRFYFAKDATLRADRVRRFLPPAALEEFVRLKRRCDPGNILQTDLSRRLFADIFAGSRRGTEGGRPHIRVEASRR